MIWVRTLLDEEAAYGYYIDKCVKKLESLDIEVSSDSYGDLVSEKELFDLFYAHLIDEGVIAHSGQIVDATFVKCPKQRNSREDNQKIKKGEKIEGWNKTKQSQKDVDATWARKGGVHYFGNKNHICVDRKSKLIKNYEVTTASVHDSNVLAPLCDANEAVFDDSAYVGKSVPEGCRHHTIRRAFRNKSLTETDKVIN